VDDEQPDHGNGTPACGAVRLPLRFVLGEDTRDDEVAGCHADGADD
jgi:hypothetical protein